MKPRLVVDNGDKIPLHSEAPAGTPLIRISSSWRAMQDGMRDYLEGDISQGHFVDLVLCYLDDEQLNADLNALEK